MPKVVFRIPTPALLAAGLAAIGATPFAFAAPGLQAVYLLPAAFAVWVLRNRTTVDRERLVARSTFGRREVAWADVKAIKVTPRGWLSAVLTDDSLVRLPAVRAGHLPALAAVSGGRIPDPKAADEPAEAPADVETEVTEEVTEESGSTPARPVPDQDTTPPSLKSEE
ncbi:PH domain-containing protein [Saccharothrix deserti]|uniref:PH domain-containing protein n=1 Tax=Saccharothrix deserti TaxID=2593674 RepID=UPI00131E7028|nr:PH domain-containing protein [Saccharothrix deserti]